MSASENLKQLLDEGYEVESYELWSPPTEVEPMDKERDGTLENWRRFKLGQTVQMTIRMSKAYGEIEAKEER